MKRDKEWFIKELLGHEIGDYGNYYNSGYEDGLAYALKLAHQLDEPEVLSQEWIDDKGIHIRGLGNIIEAEAVENLLVPEQELPVIPKYVAEYVDLAKSDVTLMRVLEIANRRDELPKWKKEYDWISANDETFARAWLDGYEVEKEKLYRVIIPTKDKLWKYYYLDDDGGINMVDELESVESHTEEFIRSVSDDLWQFSVEVAE